MNIVANSLENVFRDKPLSSSEIHPFLTELNLKDLMKNYIYDIERGVIIKNFTYTQDVIKINRNGAFIDVDNLLSDEYNQIPIEIIEHPSGTLKRMIEREFSGSGVIRMLRDSNGIKLLIIENPQLYIGEKLSRLLPIYGSKKSRAEIEERGINIFNNPNELYKITFNDPVLERIRNFHITIVGGGTVGFAMANVFSRLGVNNFSFFEKPEEDLSVSNSQRINNVGSFDVSKPKYQQFIQMVVNNNPFSSIVYYGNFDPANKVVIERLKRRASSFKDNLVVLALDDMKLRFMTHRIFEDAFRLSPTDIGPDGLMQVQNKNEAFEIPGNQDDMHNLIVEMLGGREQVVAFDLNTISSFFAMQHGAYGFFPQTLPSAIEALASLYIVQLARGKHVPANSFLNVSQNVKQPFEIAQEDSIKELILNPPTGQLVQEEA